MLGEAMRSRAARWMYLAVFALIALATMALLVVSGSLVTPANAQPEGSKTAFCHATGSQNNPFVLVAVQTGGKAFNAHRNHPNDVELGEFPRGEKNPFTIEDCPQEPPPPNGNGNGNGNGPDGPDGPNGPDGGDGGVGFNCSQIQAAVNTQYQQGEGTGAVAGAAQSLGVDQQQVLACFGTAAALQDTTVNVQGTAASDSAAATDTASASAAGGSASAAAGGALPSTGGASLLALGAGALLVAGGLLARRIVR